MKKLLNKSFVLLNVAVIVLLLLTGYSGAINPTEHPYLSLLGFAFPAFLLANLAFVGFWLMVRKRYVLLPFLGFMLCYSPVQQYCPIVPTPEHEAGALKVLSYNIEGFNLKEAPEGVPNPILEYIANSKADIVCMQEYTRYSSDDSLWTVIDKEYEYQDTVLSEGSGQNPIGIFSRYPITGKDKIHIKTKGNTLGVFVLDIEGRKVNVICAHLETVGFSVEEKEQFGEMVHGDKNRHEVKQHSKLLISKLAHSAEVRAPQADAINQFVEEHRGESIIFCGDINDHPLSYVHNTIARNLVDCYRESGIGLGFTMHYNSMYVRIDNIMCSADWTPYECHVDKSVNLSDHYPILCYLQQKNSKE